MTRKPVTVAPGERMSSVKEIFESQPIHHVLVVRQGALLGMISKVDYAHLIKTGNESTHRQLIEDSRLYNYTVDEIMTRDLITLESTERLSVALEIFSKNIISAIPIVDNGELVGLLTTHDIIKLLVAESHAAAGV
jgi:acetoin utilization protein AcuB